MATICYTCPEIVDKNFLADKRTVHKNFLTVSVQRNYSLFKKIELPEAF